MDKPIKTYTPAELAEVLHMGMTNIYKKLRTGEIPSKKIGKKILVTQQTVEKLINPEKAK